MSNYSTAIESNGTAPADILKAAGLRKTKVRSEILGLFMNHNYALSARDVIEGIDSENDRVTVYRTLSSFLENGILHKALEDGQRTKYAFCRQMGHPATENQKLHAHFTCDTCGQTFCMEDVNVPEIKVTKDYTVSSATLTLQGVCGKCNS
jgi:Fur family ferric uptake transcriptional regulator